MCFLNKIYVFAELPKYQDVFLNYHHPVEGCQEQPKHSGKNTGNTSQNHVLFFSSFIIGQKVLKCVTVSQATGTKEQSRRAKYEDRQNPGNLVIKRGNL